MLVDQIRKTLEVPVLFENIVTDDFLNLRKTPLKDPM